jgi:SAM-dependent methyltransferase
VACGYGRNTLYLLSLGASGVAIDLDTSCVSTLTMAVASFGDRRIELHASDEADFLMDCTDRFDFVCCTDYWRAGLVCDLAKVLTENGWLVMHSPGARGANYRALPTGVDVMRDVLESQLELVECRMMHAGSLRVAVTVTAVRPRPCVRDAAITAP